MGLEPDMWALSGFPLLRLAPVQQHTKARAQTLSTKCFAFIFLLWRHLNSSLKIRYIISTKHKLHKNTISSQVRMKNQCFAFITCVRALVHEWESLYILNADGQLSLEVVEVLCQLIAVVIVGEQALEKRQQLEGSETVTEARWETERVKTNRYSLRGCGWRDTRVKAAALFEKSTHRLHKIKHLPLLDLLHLEDVLQRNLVEVLPHVIHLTVRLQQRRQTVNTEGLMLRRNPEKHPEQHLTSWRCDSFFLADRLRCFSSTAQYFSVSLSYFFLASCFR